MGPGSIHQSFQRAKGVVDEVLNTFHRKLKLDLPEIEQKFRVIRSIPNHRIQNLDYLHELYSALQVELYDHMRKEENVLFPLIEKYNDPDSMEEILEHARFGSLDGPILQMEHEHNRTVNTLNEFEQITDGFSPPSNAPEIVEDLFNKLQEFSEDLRKHILFENEKLHPLALQLKNV